MDNPLTPEHQNLVMEDALYTYPVAPMPRDITADVMARIRTIPAQRPFRFTWNDVVLGMIFSLCVGAIWFSVQNLPPIVVAQIRKESILAYQYLLVNARWLIPTVAFALAGLFAALAIPYLSRELMKKSV